MVVLSRTLLASMAAVAFFCLMVNANAWAQNVDPTLQILTFTEETQLIADKRFEEAIDALDASLLAIDEAGGALKIDWDSIARDDPRRSLWMTGYVNLSLNRHLYCHAWAGLADDPRRLATCAEEWDTENRVFWCTATYDQYPVSHRDIEGCIAKDLAAEFSWTPHFQSLTRALILEAEGRYEEALKAILESSSLPFRVRDFEDEDNSTRYEITSASSLIEDVIHYRSRRLKLASPDNRQFDAYYSSLWDCPTGGGAHCPASAATLKGLQQFVNGFRLSAGDFLSDVLERPQHWLGLDAYEHPLFWSAALAHHNGDHPGVDHALSYQRELGNAVTPDVAFVLDLYAGNIDYDGAIPNDCDTAGCRYFLAQHLYGQERVEEGHAVINESSRVCDDVTSLMCAVLRYTQAKIEAGGTP